MANPQAQGTDSTRLVVFTIFTTSIIWVGILFVFVKFPAQNSSNFPTPLPQYNKVYQKQSPPKKANNDFDIEHFDDVTAMPKSENDLFVQNMETLYKKNPDLESNVEIKQSAIPNSGMGLFANRDIGASERILWAIGLVKSFEEIEEHYAKHGQSFRELSTVNGRFYIIPRADDKWSFINHKYAAGANTFFKEEYFDFKKGDTPIRIQDAPPGSQTISITASIPIKKGTELFIDYGEDYNYEAAGFKRE